MHKIMKANKWEAPSLPCAFDIGNAYRNSTVYCIILPSLQLHQVICDTQISASLRPPLSSSSSYRKRRLVMSRIILCITLLCFTQAIPAVEPFSRQLIPETLATYPSSTLSSLKVPGESPAYYCSDPSDDIF